MNTRDERSPVRAREDGEPHPGWDVTLHCNRCSVNIGRVLNVVTGRANLANDEASLGEIRGRMREHEVEHHGGRS